MPALAGARCTSGPSAASRARSAADRYASIGSTGSMMWVSASKIRMPARAMGVPPRPGRGSVPAGDPARLSGESDDVQSGVGPVGQVDEAALVRLHVVGLDRDLAASRPVRHAALGGPLG